MSGIADDNPPRVYALRFTQRARSDIDNAYNCFVELSGDEVADAWQDGLLNAVATLSTLPRRHVTVQENARFKEEVRQLIYRRQTGSIAYRILFTIVEAQDDAPIVRILHVRHGTARPITRMEARELEKEE